MPLLFDAMLGPDANLDVKRMALEAADKANIKQIYSSGASKQQWGAFVAEYKIRQILWIRTRDNPGKSTGGTQRQPPAGAATLAGREVGCAQHMHARMAMHAPATLSTWLPVAGCRRHGMCRRKSQPEQRVPIRSGQGPGEA
jgi:hypothetical protein